MIWRGSAWERAAECFLTPAGIVVWYGRYGSDEIILVLVLVLFSWLHVDINPLAGAPFQAMEVVGSRYSRYSRYSRLKVV